MAEDKNARYRPRPGQEVPGMSFSDAFREARAAGDKTFQWRDKTYTTKTAEEQGREIGARAAPGSGRGPAAGRTAADRDIHIARAESTVRRAEIPTGGAHCLTIFVGSSSCRGGRGSACPHRAASTAR